MNSRIEKACFDIILSSGALPKEALDKVYAESESSKASFTELLIKSGLLKEIDILNIYSRSLGMPVIDLKTLKIDKALLEKVPVKFAWYYKFFPVSLNRKRLQIAVPRLLDVNILDEIRLGIGHEVEVVLTPQKDVEEALKRHYGLGADTVDKILSQPGQEMLPVNSLVSIQEVEDIEKLADTASVVQLVNQIILDAYQKRASDIHIEPFRGKVRLRYRVDGVLHEAQVPPEMKRFFAAILSRIKIMANLNIVERRLPQDGKARVKTQDQSVDLRISCVPTPHGESMVIRILPSKMIYNLEELGFDPDNLALFKSLISKPHGIIFVTGPTGSGKSTTLYAGLRELNTDEHKIITIEDPIEYELEGITQIQVLPEIGLTFARGLRSVLRHDPDIMMVGEVRDFETADIAIRVALTGHLILSTLHTNDAASGVTRLLDIGVDPYLVASSVIAFVAQRLVRTICTYCKVEDREAPKEIIAEIARELKMPIEKIRVFKGKGCHECYQTGYSGRISIHEFIVLNEEIRQMIFARVNADQIRAKSKSLGMSTLRRDGWKKVIAGLTSVDEIIQVTLLDDAKTESEGGLSRVKIQKPTERMNERRNFPRLPVRVPLVYRIAGADGVEFSTKEDTEYEGVIENLSAGGLAFLTRDTLRRGLLLELKIDIPDDQTDVQCLGRIVRVSRALNVDGKFQNRVSVGFLAINSSDRSRIEGFVSQHHSLSDEKV